MHDGHGVVVVKVACAASSLSCGVAAALLGRRAGLIRVRVAVTAQGDDIMPDSTACRCSAACSAACSGALSCHPPCSWTRAPYSFPAVPTGHLRPQLLGPAPDTTGETSFASPDKVGDGKSDDDVTAVSSRPHRRCASSVGAAEQHLGTRCEELVSTAHHSGQKWRTQARLSCTPCSTATPTSRRRRWARTRRPAWCVSLKSGEPARGSNPRGRSMRLVSAVAGLVGAHLSQLTHVAALLMSRLLVPCLCARLVPPRRASWEAGLSRTSTPAEAGRRPLSRRCTWSCPGCRQQVCAGPGGVGETHALLSCCVRAGVLCVDTPTPSPSQRPGRCRCC